MYFSTRNKMPKGNGLFHYFFIKKGKKNKRGNDIFTLFGTLFTLFLLEVQKYYIKALWLANGLEIGQKAKKGHRFENNVTKLLLRILFFTNFSKFHKMLLLQAGKPFFKTKNRMGKGNILLY